MDDFDKLTENYIKELKKTDVYRQYKERLTELKKDEEMWEKVSKYREQRFDLINNTAPDELYDKADWFERDNAFIYDDIKARGFLDAEVALCRTVQDICLKITEEMDFE